MYVKFELSRRNSVIVKSIAVSVMSVLRFRATPAGCLSEGLSLKGTQMPLSQVVFPERGFEPALGMWYPVREIVLLPSKTASIVKVESSTPVELGDIDEYAVLTPLLTRYGRNLSLWAMDEPDRSFYERELLNRGHLEIFSLKKDEEIEAIRAQKKSQKEWFAKSNEARISRETAAIRPVEIPGLGQRTTEKGYGYIDSAITVIRLTPAEVAQISDWPFSDIDILVSVAGCDQPWKRSESSFDPIFSKDDGRWPKIRERIELQLVDIQRSSNWPKDSLTGDPLEVGIPVLPETVKWGEDLDGQEFFAYPAYSREATALVDNYDRKGWGIEWFGEAEKAASHDVTARQQAEDLIRTRQLEEQAAQMAEGKGLPVAVPETVVFVPALTEVMEHLGFTPEQFRFEGDQPKVVHEADGYYYSKLHERMERVSIGQSHTVWAEQIDGVWVIPVCATPQKLLGDRYDDDRGIAKDDLKVPLEKIQAANEWLDGEVGKAAEENCRRIQEFCKAVQGQPAYNCLPKGLQEEVARIWQYQPSSITGLVAKLRQSWPQAEGLLAQQTAGQILANFGGQFGRGGLHWVIRSDGSCREADQRIPRDRHHTSEGEMRWEVVQPDELALEAQVNWRDVVGDSFFKVAHLPVAGGLTTEQWIAVRKIETETGALEGSFGLDKQLNRLHATRLEAILTAAQSVLGYRPRKPYHGYFEFLGAKGLQLDDRGRLANRSVPMPPDGSYESTITTVAVSDGVLEFYLRYSMSYKTATLYMRWRQSDGEPQGEPEVVEDQEDPKPIEDLGAALSQLQAKFRGGN